MGKNIVFYAKKELDYGKDSHEEEKLDYGIIIFQ